MDLMTQPTLRPDAHTLLLALSLAETPPLWVHLNALLRGKVNAVCKLGSKKSQLCLKEESNV